MRGRGGFIKNASFSDIEINDASRQAIQINSFYESSTVVPLTDTPSELDGITIERVHGCGADQAIQIKGLPEKPLKNIVLKDIDLKAKKGMTVLDTDSIQMENVRVEHE